MSHVAKSVSNFISGTPLGQAVGFGGANYNPGLSPEESALAAEQANSLRVARSYLTGTLGQLNLLNAPGGQNATIGDLLRSREIAALKGGGAADPNLALTLQQQEQTLRNQLQAQLGPGYETTTAGMEALARFRQQAAGNIYAANSDIIDRANSNINANTSTNFGLLFGGGNALTGNASAFSAPQAPYINSQNLTTQSGISQGGNVSRILGAIFS